MQLPRFSEQQSGQMHLVGFVDTGTVTLNKNPWFASQNTRTLSARRRLTWRTTTTSWCVRMGAQARQRDCDLRSRCQEPLLDQVVKYF